MSAWSARHWAPCPAVALVFGKPLTSTEARAAQAEAAAIAGKTKACLNPTRRELLAGAAALAATVATPGSAIASSLVEQAEFAAIRFPLWGMRGMMSALSVLEHCAGAAGLSPEIYGEDIHRALRYCVFAGWAVPTETGRLRITETRRREYEAERLENWGC